MLTQIFAGPDLFSEVDSLVPKLEGADEQPLDEQPNTGPPEQPVTPRVVPSELPAGHTVVESPAVAPGCNSAMHPDIHNVPHNGDGWYVAYHAILPGTYYGV